MDNHVALSAEQSREGRSSTSARPTQYPGERDLRERERERNQHACDELLARLIEHHADKHKVIKLLPKAAPEEPKPVKAIPAPAPVIPLPVCIPEPTEAVRIPSIFMIVRETAKFYSVTLMDIKSARRTADIVKPRQVAMYLARTLTLRSLPEIGRQVGRRDHTTVLHAARKIGARIKTDDRLNDEVEVLKLRIAEVVLNTDTAAVVQ